MYVLQVPIHIFKYTVTDHVINPTWPPSKISEYNWVI
jgi:hypothetical protein